MKEKTNRTNLCVENSTEKYEKAKKTGETTDSMSSVIDFHREILDELEPRFWLKKKFRYFVFRWRTIRSDGNSSCFAIRSIKSAILVSGHTENVKVGSLRKVSLWKSSIRTFWWKFLGPKRKKFGKVFSITKQFLRNDISSWFDTFQDNWRARSAKIDDLTKWKVECRFFDQFRRTDAQNSVRTLIN